MGSWVLAPRLASPEDVPAIVSLLKSCVAAMRSAGIDQWDDVYPTEATILRDVESGCLYIAVDESSTAAGVVVLNGVCDPEYADVPWVFGGARIGVVHRLMINPELQGRGLARAMMEFIEQRARVLGYDVIRLDAFSQNPPALRLYSGLGYRDAGAMMLRKGLFRGFEKRLNR